MLEVVYRSPQQLKQPPPLDKTLGEIHYGAPAIPPAPTQRPPHADVRAAPLLHPEGMCEIWLTDAAMESGAAGPIRYRHSDTLLFGCMELDETELAGASEVHDEPKPTPTPLQRTIGGAYHALFDLVDALGYPHLLRLWNYLPAINAQTHGLERYRQFNIARQEAFLAHGRSATEGAPAACALGTAAGPMTIYFLAARSAARAIENPRQVSAYHYPREYGPRSPTFSRAALARIGEQQWLFVSGTASIIGHRTAHVGDVAAQTEETLDNIEALLAQANAATSAGAFAMERLAYKIYLRNAADLDAVRTGIERRSGTAALPIYLHADICRHDLLVEIEATASLNLHQ